MIKIENISKIGLGTYRMDLRDKENEIALRYALDSGINIIDTAPNYNFGESEHLIGKNIDRHKRDSVFIMSKVGYIQGEDIHLVLKNHLNHIEVNKNFLFSIEPDFISFQLSRTLERLNTYYLDCYLLHNPEYYYQYNPSKKILMDKLNFAFQLLEEKVQEGKIRYYGISSNDLNSLPLKEILDSLERFPNFKFLQFPYNIVERNQMFQINSNTNVTISQLKEKGLFILSNRPLNTIYENKVLRLNDYKINNINENYEDELFSSFSGIIKQRLLDLKEETSLESYYPINFFIQNRKDIGNVKAVNKAIHSYLLPFLEALELNDEKTLKTLNELREYWVLFSKISNQNRLDSLKLKLYKEGILDKMDKRDFSLILAENYLNSGIDAVLMGLRRKDYINKVKILL